MVEKYLFDNQEVAKVPKPLGFLNEQTLTSNIPCESMTTYFRDVVMPYFKSIDHKLKKGKFDHQFTPINLGVKIVDDGYNTRVKVTGKVLDDNLNGRCTYKLRGFEYTAYFLDDIQVGPSKFIRLTC